MIPLPVQEIAGHFHYLIGNVPSKAVVQSRLDGVDDDRLVLWGSET